MTAETEDDEALQAFFDEVDKLCINDNIDNIQSPAAAAAADNDTEENKTTKRDDVVNTNSKKEKKHVIANAKHNQKAWSEFKKLDLNDNTAGGSGGSEDKNKISFQIKSTKDKKKKKKKVKLPPPNNVDTNNTTATTLPINNPSIVSDNCPSWTLIIDTCSLLQQNGLKSIHQLMK